MKSEDDSKVLDAVIKEIFEIIDTYYIEQDAAKIKTLLISRVGDGLLEELARLANKPSDATGATV